MNSLFFVSSKRYTEGLLKVISYARRKSFKKLCFVSLNFPASMLRKMFRQNNMNFRNFIIIDIVTKKIDQTVKDEEHCIYLNPTHDFAELRNLFKDAGLSRKCDVIIVDSLSSMLVYHHDKEVFEAIQKISSLVPEKTSKVMYTMLKDAVQPLSHHVQMLIDEAHDTDKL